MRDFNRNWLSHVRAMVCEANLIVAVSRRQGILALVPPLYSSRPWRIALRRLEKDRTERLGKLGRAEMPSVGCNPCEEMIGAMRFELLNSSVQSEICRLELMRPQDAAYVVGWRNDPENARWFLNAAAFTVEGHNKWLETRKTSTSEVNWVIEDLGGEPVGTVSIYNIDSAAGRAEFGRLLIGSPSARRRGLGCEAVRLATGLAIKAGLGELFLEVKASNLAARHLYAKAGFEQASQGDVIKMTKRLGVASNGQIQ